MFSTKSLALTLAVFAVAFGAQAQTIKDIAGHWDLTINAMGRDYDMALLIEEHGEGIAVSVSGEQGGQEADKAAYKDGVLSLTMSLGPASLDLSVPIAGDTFDGQSESSFGPIGLKGRKLSAEEAAERVEALNRFIGDYDTSSDFGEKTHEGKMRISVQDGKLTGTVAFAGGDLDNEESFRVFSHENTLRWRVDIPYVTSKSSEAVVTVAEDNTFEGTVNSSLGKIALRGKQAAADGFVLVPFDDPTAILGDWALNVEFAGQPGEATLTITKVGDLLHADLVSVLGEITSDEIEYKKLGDTKGTIRIYTQIEVLGEGRQIFEFNVDGDSLEGAELTTDGMIRVQGKRPGTGEETDQSDPTDLSDATEEPQQ